MAKSKQKYYVVWKGNNPGIYDNWPDCKKQIDGYTGAIFKSFTNSKIATEAFANNPEKYIGDNYIEPTMLEKYKNANIGFPIQKSISVDAACAGNPGILEYQGVDTRTKKKLFHQGPFPKGTVNIGEFLALVHGLAYLKQQNSNIPIYSDSKTAIAWVRRKAINTKLERNKQTEALFKLVDRAIFWLKNNNFDNKILKWETAYWGEIPADFGRK